MSDRKVENVTRPKRNKSLKFLRIKNSVIYTALIFVIRQIFPVLCCICKAPGKSLCLSCLRRCCKRVPEQRCSRCLETVGIGESVAACAACAVLPPHLSLYLYEHSLEALALYRSACLGNVCGERSFSLAASRALVLHQSSIARVVFFSKDIKKNVAAAIAKHLNVPYEKVSFFRRKKLLASQEKICILSVCPLNKTIREEIVGYCSTGTLFMSLFSRVD